MVLGADLFFMLGVLSAAVLLLNALSDLMRKYWVSEIMLATLIGVVIGPYGVSWFRFESAESMRAILEQLARVTLAVGLMGIALRLPAGYVSDQKRYLSWMLGFGMPLMWLSASIILYALLDIPFVHALLIGAVMTPTDPVVSSAIVTGKIAQRFIPSAVRYNLSAESGANDGLGYPFVMLPLLIITTEYGVARFSEHFILNILLWEVAVAVFVGAVIGYLAGALLRVVHEREWAEVSSYLGFTVAVSLLVLAVARLMHTDGILAVFVSGLVLRSLIPDQEQEVEDEAQETFNRFLVIPAFILGGIALPLSAWTWGGGIAVAVALIVRRIFAVLIVSPGLLSVHPTNERLFIGWFGPVGIAALFYAMLAEARVPEVHVWHYASMAIAASLVIHGVSATPAAKLLYAKDVR